MSEVYRWRGGTEPWLQFGSDCPLQIIMIEPLFEEANRCRRLIVQILRGLAARGVGSVLPDLPATGESLREIATVTLADWYEAMTAVAEVVQPVVVASVRGGALLDNPPAAHSQWRFAPESGTRIVRDLKRTQLAVSSVSQRLYAGHALSDAFLTSLEAAVPAAVPKVRTIRLESDAGEADAKYPGSPLWRRAEPGDDADLAARLTDDLFAWVQTCANG